MQLYLDLDGVLADFDGHHEAVFGFRPNRDKDPDWNSMRTLDFYKHIPPMKDMRQLWDATKALNPIILTGLPSSIPLAETHKREWIACYLGPVPVIATLSKLKSDYCQPGDILVDDWDKYRHLWEARGGVWIPHTSAASSIVALRDLGVI